MFNAVDIVVVGRFSGSQSLAAVGATTALIYLFYKLIYWYFSWCKCISRPILCGGESMKKCLRPFIQR